MSCSTGASPASVASDGSPSPALPSSRPSIDATAKLVAFSTIATRCSATKACTAAWLSAFLSESTARATAFKPAADSASSMASNTAVLPACRWAR
jgi:hypothetical protein